MHYLAQAMWKDKKQANCLLEPSRCVLEALTEYLCRVIFVFFFKMDITVHFDSLGHFASTLNIEGTVIILSSK